MSWVWWVSYGFCAVVNLFIFVLAFLPGSSKEERLSIAAWGLFSASILVIFVLFGPQDSAFGSDSKGIFIFLAIGWVLLAVIFPVIVWVEYGDEISRQMAHMNRKLRNSLGVTPYSVRSLVREVPRVRRQKTQSDTSYKGLNNKSPEVSLEEDESVESELLRVLLSATTRSPKLKPDLNSQLRARGMTRLYSNWKKCYFLMNKPFGQQVLTEVVLIEEPENPNDVNAIMVCYGYLKLGYIPREIAAALKPILTKSGGVVRADAELWFDFRSGQKRNSIRLLVARPFSIE